MIIKIGTWGIQTLVYFSAFLSLTGFVLAFQQRFNSFREYSFFFTVSSIICLLAVAAWVHVLQPVATLIYLVGLGLFFALTYINGRKILSLSSPTVLLWLVVGVGLGLRVQNYFVHLDDEFHFYGSLSKYLWSTHHLPNILDRGYIGPDHPHGVAVFQYFLGRPIKVFSEGALYFAHNLLLVAPLFVFFKDVERQKLPFVTGIILVFSFFLTFSLGSSLSSLFVDGVLATFFGMTLVSYFYFFRERKEYLLFLAPPIVCMVLTRNTGFHFALLTSGIILLDQLVMLKRTGELRAFSLREDRFRPWLGLVSVAIFFACVFAAQTGWRAYVNSIGYSPRLGLTFKSSEPGSLKVEFTKTVCNMDLPAWTGRFTQPFCRDYFEEQSVAKANHKLLVGADDGPPVLERVLLGGRLEHFKPLNGPIFADLRGYTQAFVQVFLTFPVGLSTAGETLRQLLGLKSSDQTIAKGISADLWCVGIILLFMINFFLLRKVDLSQARSMKLLSWILFIGFVTYMVSLYVALLVTVGFHDLANLFGGWGRYTSVYLQGWLLVGFAFTLNLLVKRYDAVSKALAIAVCLSLIYASNPRFIKDRPTNINQAGPRAKTFQMANFVKSKIPENEKFLLYWQNDSNYPLALFRFDLNPRQFDFSMPWSLGPQYYKDDPYTRPISLDTFISDIKAYKYLLVVDNGKQWWDHYGSKVPAIVKVDKNEFNSNPDLANVELYLVDSAKL